ncbi:MAG TPA: phosphate ABC transporter substrate-binding/OmpA family protein [Anaeromyxobacter sp.]|nr:phosphate ABC transporter substrate-binding/OmpA family protein [Anaeromyxobacter sp.]
MQTLLQDLNSLPGVIGSLFCDPQQGVLCRAFPPSFDDASLTAVAAAVAAAGPELRGVTGPIGVLDLRYREARVMVRPAGTASLLVLYDKAANAQEVLAFASVACKKLERLREPGAPGGTPARATPAPPPAATGAPAPPAAPIPSATARERRLSVTTRRPVPLFPMALGAVAIGAVVVFGIYSLRSPSRAAAPAPGAQEAPAPIRGPIDVRLRLSGADALAAELVPALAQAWLSSQKAVDIEVSRQPDLVSVAAVLEGRPVGVEISAGGTARGLDDLLAGKADVALATRRVKLDERQRLSVLGVMTSPANEHVLGLGAVAVIVNSANTVQALSRDQLAAILSGAASDWSQFGVAADEEWSAVGVNGKGGPVASGVHVYLPDDRTGLPELVQAAVLEGRPYVKDAKRLATNQAVADAVIADPGGVAIVPMSATAGARVVPVSDPAAPALVPTAFTVASEDYLLTHRLYLYTAQASQNPAVARFVEFALSADGQALVRKAGFVELGVKAERRTPPAGAPPDYLRLTAGARRLSSTFRFEAGEAAFDTRAQRDLDRVVEYLRENDLGGSAVRILGFADGSGSKAANLQLSADRAAQVARAFAQRGVSGATVAGLGSALPVADNATEEGRGRNRRVEVWVAR